MGRARPVGFRARTGRIRRMSLAESAEGAETEEEILLPLRPLRSLRETFLPGKETRNDQLRDAPVAQPDSLGGKSRGVAAAVAAARVAGDQRAWRLCLLLAGGSADADLPRAAGGGAAGPVG